MAKEQSANTHGSKLVMALKSIVGAPIPILLLCFSISLGLHETSAYYLSISVSSLGLLYILIDRFNSDSEFSFFRLGFDFPILLLSFCSILAFYSDFNLNLNSFSISIRWALFVYLLTYTLNLFPSLNKIFYSIMFVGSSLAIYGIIQAVIGLDILNGSPVLAAFSSPSEQLWAASGMFQNIPLYALFMCLSACIFFAAFICQKYKWEGAGIFYLILCILSLIAIYFTYDARYWFAIICALAVISYMKSVKNFILYFFSFSLIVGAIFQFNDNFRGNIVRSLQHYTLSQNQENANWESHLQSFKSHKWIGTGLSLEEIDLNSPNNSSNFKNSFLHMLLQGGIIGFAGYALLMLLSVFMCLRLLLEIPKTHYWHQVFVLSILGFLASFHISGLGYYNFSSSPSRLILLFVTAVIAYMSHAYGKGIVPDDRIL